MDGRSQHDGNAFAGQLQRRPKAFFTQVSVVSEMGMNNLKRIKFAKSLEQVNELQN
jgi:hypothetical protein